MVSFRFQKTDRIVQRADFAGLSATGRKLVNRHFVLIYLPGRSPVSRLGLTVSRRVGNAVVRNRIKRQTREFFRCNRHRYPGVWDVNVIARATAAGETQQRLHASLDHLFRKMSRENRG